MSDHVELTRTWQSVVASWPVETRQEHVREADRLEAAGWTRAGAEYLSFARISDRMVLAAIGRAVDEPGEGTARGNEG